MTKAKELAVKRTVSIFLFLLFFLPSLACGAFTTNFVDGSGDVVDQTFEVRDFDRVTLEGFGSVFIEQGQTESLSVETDENIIPLLDIRVQGNELHLGIKRGYDVRPSQSITFNLTVKDLNAVAVEGSGDFYVEPVSASNLAVSIDGSGNIDIKGVTGDSLSIDLDGSGNITIEDLEVQTIDTSLQGSGDIELEGNADRQEVSVNGSGNYLAGELETVSTDIRIPGSADVTVWTSEDLNIQVSGSGNVQYFGAPRVDQSGSGSGNITSLGDK
jgi:hypothetical protein